MQMSKWYALLCSIYVDVVFSNTVRRRVNQIEQESKKIVEEVERDRFYMLTVPALHIRISFREFAFSQFSVFFISHSPVFLGSVLSVSDCVCVCWWKYGNGYYYCNQLVVIGHKINIGKLSLSGKRERTSADKSRENKAIWKQKNTEKKIEENRATNRVTIE